MLWGYKYCMLGRYRVYDFNFVGVIIVFFLEFQSLGVISI